MRNIPTEDVARALQALVDGASAARGPVADSVAARKTTRVARLVAATARLEQELGSDDPDVLRMKEIIRAQEPQRAVLTRRGERERRRPSPKPHEWMAYGRVVNHDGSPAKGARVRLFDLDRKYDDLLGEARVDEFGDFSIGPFHDRDFFEHGEEAPELYLKIYGARNRLVYNGEQDARFPAGRIEYFEVVLPPPEKATRSTSRKKGRKRG